MKKIEIIIKEINLDDKFNPIEDKSVNCVHILTDSEVTRLNDNLPFVLDDRWSLIKSYFLNKRKEIPFRKIRRDHE